jgi:ATP-binding cassette, subfamily B, bacterial PglK
MLVTARKVFVLLSRRERLRLGLLALAVLITAFLEMVNVAAILPFLSVAADPTQVQRNVWLAWAYESGGFTSANSFLIALAAAALVTLVLTNAWMAVTVWIQARFSLGRMHTLGARLLEHYAARPFVFFLGRNSADLSKNVLNEVGQVALGVIMPGVQLLARSVISLAIVGLLLAFDPMLAMITTLVLGGAYAGVFIAVRRRLGHLGKERVAVNRERFKSASELFGAIKDVKLLGKESEFVEAFTVPSLRFTHNQSTAAIIGQAPRYALEAIAFGGVLLIALYLLARGGGSLQQIIPILGLYAFAGFRLMPSLQQLFQALTQIRFNMPAVDNLYTELADPPPGPCVSRRSNGHAPGALTLHQRLELRGVSFAYPGAPRRALQDLSLTVDANTTIGIVGATGSGKTTLVDVILGLLRPQAGEIRIDGTPLTEANLRAWQNGIGYVPQHIYLSEDTVARNIAFGIPSERIDMAAVERAARIAQIHDFVTEELHDGYATIVGERGIRLSGGQCQRIGIARALYHEPSVLVFDEATSALDHRTEAALMAAVNRLAGSRTLLIVAHRHATLQSCQAIYEMVAGQIIPQINGLDGTGPASPYPRSTVRVPTAWHK